MGKFFSFDGVDGVGKSTQLALFCRWLTVRGHEPVVCRDPGSTSLGEKIRSLLLDHDEATAIDPRSEMLLYMAARAQLVDEVIRPALASGKTVVSDRFLLANVVYQGYAGGIPVEEVRAVGAVAVAGTSPDCTFLLDMCPSASRNRFDRPLDRIESRGDEYRSLLRQGFLSEAKAGRYGIRVIDADRSIEAVHEEICRIAESVLA